MVSCTVMAVITDSGWQPMLASVRISACRPAPPEGSPAEKASTMRGVGAGEGASMSRIVKRQREKAGDCR